LEFNNWNGKTFAEVVRDFSNFINTMKEVYFKDKDVESEMMRKQNDLLHDLELGDLKYHDIAKIGKEIRNLRINRREYKNEYLLNESIKEFYKDYDGQKLIDRLNGLADRLEKDANMIQNQYYNKRSNIDNLANLKKDSGNHEDSESEDLIQLNRVLKKYCLSLDSSILKDKNGSNLPVIEAKMQMEMPFSLKKGKQLITDLGNNIEKFYKPGLHDITCRISSSDMMLPDQFGKNTLTGQIHIILSDDVIYELHVTIREGKSHDKKNKRGKKKGRR